MGTHVFGVEMEMEMEMDQLGEEKRESDTLIQMELQTPEREIEGKIEDWVGVHSLKNMPKSFKPQEPSTMDFSSLIQSLRAQEETKDGSSGKNRNRMTKLFCPPGAAETDVLKTFFKKMKKDQSKSNPISRHNIILLNAKNPDTLKESFKNVAKILDRKVDTQNLCTKDIVDKIYAKIHIENCPKDRNLFVFVGAKSLSEIQQFLPKDQVVLPFCQFLVTTSSKTVNWESKTISKSESKSEEWSIKNFLVFDKELIGFDWEGVHSASELPASFQPITDFAGRAEIMNKLVQRFQNIPSSPISERPRNFRHSFGAVPKQGESLLFLPLVKASLSVISGISGIGKTELVKQFLSTHPQLFAKVVLINASNPLNSLKVFAHNSGIYSESTIEGATESESKKIASLHSEITKNLQGNQRVLFVFDNADSLEEIKNYLPKNFKRNGVICHVIVTSRSRNWEKEEDVKFYRANNYQFHEIPLFDGLRLDETHEFCSKILPQNGILYLRKDLERSISELHKLTGGFPTALQNLTASIFRSSRTNPEWSPKLHILKYLSRDFQQFRLLIKPFSWNQLPEFPEEPKSSVEKPYHEKRLLQILCLMNPNHLDFHMICYFYYEHENPFQPPGQTSYEPEQVRHVEDMLRTLEINSLIQVDRRNDGKDDGKIDKIRIPAFLREFLNAENTDATAELTRLLHGRKRPYSSWTRPLNVPELWPHILSTNESYTRFHGFYNQVLIECIQNHLEFWRNPPKDEEIPGEERPNTNYETEKNKIKELFEENRDFKSAFGDFSQVENPEFPLTLVFLILFVLDVGSDINSSRIMFKGGHISYFCLSLFLIIFPFLFLCEMHRLDRTDYNTRMKNGRRMTWCHIMRSFTGTFDSYVLQLWYIWRFRRETDNLERGLLYERLCIMRANAQYQSIAEPFMESLPQLLLQFPLYLLSYTKEYSDLSGAMQDSFIRFELSLVVSLFSFGLALTRLESVYFGWNMELFGMKLLGYRSIHLLLNVTHIATLVFCSGVVSVVFPPFIFVISLVFCLTATAWILSHSDALDLPPWIGQRLEMFTQTKLQKFSTFVAAFHPAYVEKGKKLEATSKHQFVSARLGHDMFFLQRHLSRRDIVYFVLFFSSVLISTLSAIYLTIRKKIFNIPLTKIVDTASLGSFWTFRVIQNHSFYFILWLPLLSMWQVLRQLLNNVYLRYSKVPPLTEDYILNDPEGIIRYPADTLRWIHRRLYYQIRQNQPSEFSQTWTQMKQIATQFNERTVFSKFKILFLIVFKIQLKMFYFLWIMFLLCLIPYNTTLLRVYYPTLYSNSSLEQVDSVS